MKITMRDGEMMLVAPVEVRPNVPELVIEASSRDGWAFTARGPECQCVSFALLFEIDETGEASVRLRRFRNKK